MSGATTNKSHLAAALTALLVTFLWSTSWVLVKIGLKSDLPSVTFAGLRYSLAFLGLLPWVAFNSDHRQIIRELSAWSWSPKNISLLSNPVINMLNVQINNLDNANIDFQILDVTGKIWMNQKYQTTSTSDVMNLPVESLPSGSFFLKASINGDVQSLKFTKI